MRSKSWRWKCRSARHVPKIWLKRRTRTRRRSSSRERRSRSGSLKMTPKSPRTKLSIRRLKRKSAPRLERWSKRKIWLFKTNKSQTRKHACSRCWQNSLRSRYRRERVSLMRSWHKFINRRTSWRRPSSAITISKKGWCKYRANTTANLKSLIVCTVKTITTERSWQRLTKSTTCRPSNATCKPWKLLTLGQPPRCSALTTHSRRSRLYTGVDFARTRHEPLPCFYPATMFTVTNVLIQMERWDPNATSVEWSKKACRLTSWL